MFGAGWSGPLFSTNWRAAFFYTGVVSILLAVAYYPSARPRRPRRPPGDRRQRDLKQWVHTATRYGTVALALAYVMSFGLELSMNGWLATYYREAFNTDNLVLASTFAATFSIAAGLLRPIGGYVSDVLARKEMDILPVLRGPVPRTVDVRGALVHRRLHARDDARRPLGDLLSRSPPASWSAWPARSLRALSSRRFPRCSPTSRAVAGVVGGVGTIGGITYPLVYSSVLLPNLHVGYALVAATMVPIVLLSRGCSSRRRETITAGVGDGPRRHHRRLRRRGSSCSEEPTFSSPHRDALNGRCVASLVGSARARPTPQFSGSRPGRASRPRSVPDAQSRTRPDNRLPSAVRLVAGAVYTSSNTRFQTDDSDGRFLTISYSLFL